MSTDTAVAPLEGRFRTYCTQCRKTLSPGYQPFCRECDSMADVEYDPRKVTFHDSPNPYLRYRDLLPVSDPALLPQDAQFSNTRHATKLGDRLGMPWLFLKDETSLPTGTTKDRMAAVALPYLYECGVRRFCTSSTGNSSTAYARGISRFPDMRMYLFTASQFRDRVQHTAGGQVVQFVLRDATFVEAFDAARDFALKHNIVSERGFFNPGRREGLKVAWLEAAEQAGRPLDWYVQGISSAMGVYGVFRAAKQLLGLGKSPRLPRLLCVQQETCAPMVAAWRDKAEKIEPRHIVERPIGIAQAILRGNPTRSYPPVRDIVVESGGTFTSVSEREIREARRMIEDLEGISPCFSASTAMAGLIKQIQAKEFPVTESVLVNLTGSDRKAEGEEPRYHFLKRCDDGWTPEDPADELTRAHWDGNAG